MPFAKGKPKTGGRKPGTRNKITSDISYTLSRLGCDPITGMAKIALSKSKKIDDALRLRAFAELAQYVFPKRRAVEITPGKVDPNGAQLVPLTELMADFHRLRAEKAAKPAAQVKAPATKLLPGVPRKK